MHKNHSVSSQNPSYEGYLEEGFGKFDHAVLEKSQVARIMPPLHGTE